MAIQQLILPNYSTEFIPYRIPDECLNSTVASKDYLYTANNKDFIFKAVDGTVSYVNIDFFNLDNSYFINNSFRTI